MSMAIAQNTLAESTVIVAAKDHIGCNLGGEEVILNMTSGIYYGLNNVGSRIWEHVQKPIAVCEIVDSIANEYDVERNRCENAVFQFLNDLVEHGLLEIRS